MWNMVVGRLSWEKSNCAGSKCCCSNQTIDVGPATGLLVPYILSLLDGDPVFYSAFSSHTNKSLCWMGLFLSSLRPDEAINDVIFLSAHSWPHHSLHLRWGLAAPVSQRAVQNQTQILKAALLTVSPMMLLEWPLQRWVKLSRHQHPSMCWASGSMPHISPV